MSCPEGLSLVLGVVVLLNLSVAIWPACSRLYLMPPHLINTYQCRSFIAPRLLDLESLPYPFSPLIKHDLESAKLGKCVERTDLSQGHGVARSHSLSAKLGSLPALLLTVLQKCWSASAVDMVDSSAHKCRHSGSQMTSSLGILLPAKSKVAGRQGDHWPGRCQKEQGSLLSAAYIQTEDTRT